MNTIEKYGSDLQIINKFVTLLDPAVRTEAFKFLIARHFNQPTADDKSTAVLAEPSQPESRSQHRTLAPQELLRRVGAATIFEKAVLFGYWLEMHHGDSSFSGSKLKDVFEMARERASFVSPLLFVSSLTSFP